MQWKGLGLPYPVRTLALTSSLPLPPPHPLSLCEPTLFSLDLSIELYGALQIYSLAFGVNLECNYPKTSAAMRLPAIDSVERKDRAL